MVFPAVGDNGDNYLTSGSGLLHPVVHDGEQKTCVWASYGYCDKLQNGKLACHAFFFRFLLDSRML